jgi:hypothetical protein
MQWLPPDIVQHHYLSFINPVMAQRAKNMGQARRNHRSAVAVIDFYCFLSRYWLTILLEKGRLRHHIKHVEDLQKELMGKERYEEIYACCDWTPERIKVLHDDFNLRAPTLIVLGSIIVIDETLLAYFGADGKIDEILRLFPGKPHDYGLLGYRGVAKLLVTRSRVIVHIIPILPDAKYTPTGAALAIIKRLRANQRGTPHFIMDSAFATEEMLAELKRMDAAVSLSLKCNRSAGYTPVYEMATMELAPGETRSYSVDGYILQASRLTSKSKEGGLPYHVVLSNGWRSVTDPNPPVKRLLSYKSVRTLYKCEDDASLAEFLQVPNVGSKRDMILTKTHWDVLAPPPGPDGQIHWTAQSLEAMGLDLLRDLHLITRKCTGGSKKNVAQLVKDILEHHPVAQLPHLQASQKHPRAVDIVALREHVGLHNSKSSDVLKFYSQEYGAVDETNQEIYRSILLRYHRSWTKLAGFSVLHAIFMNAWSSFVEADIYAQTHDRLGMRLDVAIPSHQAFNEYMWDLCMQVAERKKSKA